MASQYLHRLSAWVSEGSLANRFIQLFQLFTRPDSGGARTVAPALDDNGRLPESQARDEILWRHAAPEKTQMWAFMQKVNTKYDYSFQTYQDLHHWSITHRSEFWAEAWDFCGIRYSRFYDQVVDDAAPMWPPPAWFSGARLNFAENLLFPTQTVSEETVAVISIVEGDGDREFITWKDLRERVRRCQAGLHSLKIQPGDRVAGYVANHSTALVAMLATTSLGAIWTAVSPDTGVKGTLDRLVQVEPRLLFTDNAVVYNAKLYSVLPKTQEIVASLPSLEAVVVVPTAASIQANLPGSGPASSMTCWTYEGFLTQGSEAHRLEFVHMPAEHPLYILYSSGTTGEPKCIVHGAIGTLLQHKKEHILQSDIRAGDRLCYVTTCMWMMWHWLVSGLASGATVVLYNGSPFYYTPVSQNISVKEELAMPKLIDELGITQFGASATYFSMLERGGHWRKTPSMKTLKAVYSTGSPLGPSTFRYIYRAFGPHVNLGSISGGTDIISDFGVPSPLKPVVTGEIQAIALGMAVQTCGPTGIDLSATGEPGELIQFWGASGSSRYQSSYFARYPGIWAHGDHIRINPRTGGLIMLGRSDGTLNPSGVRFGSAEIYNLLQHRFAAQIEDGLCVGRRRQQDSDETVVLFIKMRQGQRWTLALTEAICRTVREELSPRHVPGLISECPEIPVTANGKKVEVLVKKIISGLEDSNAGGSGTVNVECLRWFQDWASRN
ncbi:acetoacetate-CoA ligase [Aspergillus costaricaensis CBS 115574]|uniref:Acetoacetate-CoA ligase n=1 Tax=Aspergillus costaricaensis CBS 115574 TaxID=1448317 RepID=A0ACD1IBB4_9EURO|nr:acetoacetate-CoA ligase [Aspergillus costaricaensis CBS 115574]RAK87874.1 acetoacetate-CoA ligase [Aspergillus costaricaensis CBS 115574]